MEVSIDALGRILIPKRVRRMLGLTSNAKLDLKVEDGAMVLEPKSGEAEVVKTDSGLMIIRGIPPVTHEELERIKHEQAEHRFRS
jgi:AbrB family looped-hinge helix DNA binding protein